MSQNTYTHSQIQADIGECISHIHCAYRICTPLYHVHMYVRAYVCCMCFFTHTHISIHMCVVCASHTGTYALAGSLMEAQQPPPRLTSKHRPWREPGQGPARPGPRNQVTPGREPGPGPVRSSPRNQATQDRKRPCTPYSRAGPSSRARPDSGSRAGRRADPESQKVR